MKNLLGLLLAGSIAGTAALGAEKKSAPDRAKLEEMTRLQIFLDRANFGPGKIDGRGGEFTKKALEMYRSANASQPAEELATEKPTEKPKSAKEEASTKGEIDTSDLDLAGVGEAFTNYTVTADDVQNTGEVPKEPAEMAKLKTVPYRSVLEAVAEKFHSDVDFIKELNPDAKTDALKEGDTLVVPNVEPFDLAAVKQIKPGEAAAEQDPDATEQKSRKSDSKEKSEESEKSHSSSPITVRITTKDKMLEVRDGEKLVAAFPVTPGSDDIPTPVGEWKVMGVAKMPDFRHDEKMLKEGERGEKAHLIPPGPNNPVGVIWIALNKKGIGIHGTDDPDTIGRAASHGCIRLANWDIVKVAAMVKGGVPVKIE